MGSKRSLDFAMGPTPINQGTWSSATATQLNRNDNPLPPLWHLGLPCTHPSTSHHHHHYKASSLDPQRLAKPKPSSSAPITSWRVALPAPMRPKYSTLRHGHSARATDRPKLESRPNVVRRIAKTILHGAVYHRRAGMLPNARALWVPPCHRLIMMMIAI